MGDSLRMSRSTKNLEPIITSKRQPEMSLVATTSSLSGSALKGFSLMNQVIPGKSAGGDIGLFILKLVALDVVRRFSSAKFPFVWHGLQALQLLCYPPLKWIQRWAPLRGLVKYMKCLSRPMLVLSVATTLYDASLSIQQTSKGSSDSLEGPDSPSLPISEPLASPSTSDTRISDEVPQSSKAEKWMLQLLDELQKQGFTLPERISEQELRRFYIAANGDFSSLLSSVKKTIRWRETYVILSQGELKVWSHLVFWHGRDVKLRPCLIIRLGLASSNLMSKDKPRFAQAVVSQVEHGVLHLVDAEDRQIVVLMDCEGLSPFKFPMQMMRSIAVLLQDHYPNCLGSLLIVRLPPVARVIIQTLTQVLKPVTRKKVRIIGENHRKILLEYLQTLPSFLGGQCSCPKCSNVGNGQGMNGEMNHTHSVVATTSEEDNSSSDVYDFDSGMHDDCGQILRTAVICILMVWIFIAIMVVWTDK